MEDVKPVRNSDRISDNLTVRNRSKIDSYCSRPEALGLKEKLKFFEENSRKIIEEEATRNSEEDPSKESRRKKILKIEEEEGKWKEKEENHRKNEEQRKCGKMERSPWNGIGRNDVERKKLGISPRGKIGKHFKPKINEKIQELKKQLIEGSSPLSSQVRPVHSKFNFYAVQEKGLGLRTEMKRTPGLATAPESAGNGPTRRDIREKD